MSTTTLVKMTKAGNFMWQVSLISVYLLQS